MRASEIYACSEDGRLWQGGILSGLVQHKLLVTESAGDTVDVDRVTHPFAVVLTQDCDLTWDFDARARNDFDKMIPSILFCEAIELETLLEKQPGSDVRRRIKRNQDERYQFLESVAAECDAQADGLPDLGLDFKRYFTISPDDVYHQLSTKTAVRRARLTSPYLENFCSRFYNFQCRVAVPRNHGQSN